MISSATTFDTFALILEVQCTLKELQIILTEYG